MLKAFRLLACTGLLSVSCLTSLSKAAFEPWARAWNRVIGGAFLREDFQTIGPSELLPSNQGDLQVMLQAYLMNKAPKGLRPIDLGPVFTANSRRSLLDDQSEQPELELKDYGVLMVENIPFHLVNPAGTSTGPGAAG